MSSRVLQLLGPLGEAGLRRAAAAQPMAPPRWCRRELAGRLSEISGQGASALLAVGVELVLDAQREGEPTAWVMVGEDSAFFAPDVARAGVDLDALAVIRAPDAGRAARAAARLARSGAFGLLVLDLSRPGSARQDARAWLDAPRHGDAATRVSTALMARLIGLAQRHDLAVVFLTARAPGRPSLDALISLRAQACRDTPLGQGRFGCHLEIAKDKRRGPSWRHEGHYQGPPGLW